MAFQRIRRIWLLGLAAALAIVAALAITLLGGDGMEQLSVGELLARSTSLSGQIVNVRGVVTPGTVSWEEATEVLTFALAGDDAQVRVVYEGLPPDDFRSGADLLVVGTFTSDGVLQAVHIREPGTLCAVCH